jgi:hypothetical protein
MWIFYSGGMLLPSLANEKTDPSWTQNGKYPLQVRGREIEHLKNFLADYMDPMGLEHTEIEETPHRDYTCRFYCTAEDFALAVAAAVRDIDYSAFKESSERRDGKKLRYKTGREYHNLLIDIWSTTARWRRPGGYWGRVYTPRSGQLDLDADWGNYDLDGTDGVLDYTPGTAQRKLSILAEVKDVPASQWGSYLTDEELKLVLSEHTAALKKENPSRRRRNRKKAS